MLGGSAGSSQVAGPTQTPNNCPRVELQCAGALIGLHALRKYDLTCRTRNFYALTPQICEQTQSNGVCESPRHAQAYGAEKSEAGTHGNIAKEGSQCFMS